MPDHQIRSSVEGKILATTDLTSTVQDRKVTQASVDRDLTQIKEFVRRIAEENEFEHSDLDKLFDSDALQVLKQNQSQVIAILSYFATSLFDKNKIYRHQQDSTGSGRVLCILTARESSKLSCWILALSHRIIPVLCFSNRMNIGPGFSDNIEFHLSDSGKFGL